MYMEHGVTLHRENYGHADGNHSLAILGELANNTGTGMFYQLRRIMLW